MYKVLFCQPNNSVGLLVENLSTFFVCQSVKLFYVNMIFLDAVLNFFSSFNIKFISSAGLSFWQQKYKYWNMIRICVIVFGFFLFYSWLMTIEHLSFNSHYSIFPWYIVLRYLWMLSSLFVYIFPWKRFSRQKCKMLYFKYCFFVLCSFIYIYWKENI